MEEEYYDLEERLIEFLGSETVLNEVLQWLDSDTKERMLEDIYCYYDLDIA